MRSDIWHAPNKCTVHYHFSCLFCTCNFSPSPLSLQLAFCHHPPIFVPLPLYIHAFRHLACTKQMHNTLSFLVPFLYMQFFPLSPLLAIGFLPPPPHICSPPFIYSCVQTSGVHQTNAQYTIISRAFSVHAIFPPLPSPCNWLFATTPPPPPRLFSKPPHCQKISP